MGPQAAHTAALSWWRGERVEENIWGAKGGGDSHTEASQRAKHEELFASKT